jgi:hypothetical protein
VLYPLKRQFLKVVNPMNYNVWSLGPLLTPKLKPVSDDKYCLKDIGEWEVFSVNSELITDN